MKNCRCVLLVALAAGLMTGCATEAEETSGAPAADSAPAPRSAPPLWLPEDAYLSWPVPAAEQKYTALDPARIKGTINELVAISRASRDAGNQFWGRIVGSEYDKRTTDLIAEEMRRIGLQVRVQEWDLAPTWYPTSWQVSVSGKTGGPSPVTTAYPLLQSPSIAETELEPVWLGLGWPADFVNRDVRGKAVVLYGIATTGGNSNSASRNGAIARAEEAGAAAVFIVYGMPGNVTSMGGGTRGRIPAFMIGNDDGEALRERIERGEAPRIRLRLATEMRSGLKSASVWGVLPGMTDENIAVEAHTEAYFDGALDNASGVGTMLELARYFAARPKEQRRRTMTFFTTGTHHAGESKDVGSPWIFLNMQDMWRKTALLVNCEHTAWTQSYVFGDDLVTTNAISAARRYFVGGSDELKGLVKRNLNAFGVGTFSAPEERPGGELRNLYTAAPSVHIIHNTLHNDTDRPEAIPVAGLATVVRAFAKTIDDANTLDLAALRRGLPTRPSESTAH